MPSDDKTKSISLYQRYLLLKRRRDGCRYNLLILFSTSNTKQYIERVYLTLYLTNISIILVGFLKYIYIINRIFILIIKYTDIPVREIALSYLVLIFHPLNQIL